MFRLQVFREVVWRCFGYEYKLVLGICGRAS